MSLASILLILFLEPPGRLFAAWTRPSPDRRPAVLVVALLAALLTALVVPTLRDYFGLTRPAGIVYQTTLPLLLLWFLTLAAAYRFRLMDRLLGIPDHAIERSADQDVPHLTAAGSSPAGAARRIEAAQRP